jgi:hypothetical protein
MSVLVAAVTFALTFAILRWPWAEHSAAPTATPDQFVGTWRVHGESVELRRDLTGTSTWKSGPCEDADPAGPDTTTCTGRADLALTVVGDTLAAQVTSVTYTDSQGRTFGPPSGGYTSQHRFELVTVDRGVLRRHVSPAIQGANPNLCSDDASAEWRRACNI